MNEVSDHLWGFPGSDHINPSHVNGRLDDPHWDD